MNRNQKAALSMLEARVEDYKRFLPDWPALAQSFQLDLDKMRDELSAEDEHVNP